MNEHDLPGCNFVHPGPDALPRGVGAEVEGVFTLFALNFFLLGVILFGLGLLGEYVGRIYQQVRKRPRYVVMGVLESDAKE